MSVLHKPLVTEKFQDLSERYGKYAFVVNAKATKDEIAREVERVYEVKVTGINTMRYAGSRKVRYTKTSIQEGRRPAYKKAVVTLAEGQEIDFYSNV
jgi:large subunit ribosomal protein L23